MIRDYDGATVFDGAGNEIGSVEQSYDDETGAVKYVEIRMGSLFGKHRLIPMDLAEVEDDGLHVPFSKGAIEASPDASDAGDVLQADLLASVDSYYDRLRQMLTSASPDGDIEPAAVPAGSADAPDEEKE